MQLSRNSTFNFKPLLPVCCSASSLRSSCSLHHTRETSVVTHAPAPIPKISHRGRHGRLPSSAGPAWNRALVSGTSHTSLHKTTTRSTHVHFHSPALLSRHTARSFRRCPVALRKKRSARSVNIPGRARTHYDAAQQQRCHAALVVSAADAGRWGGRWDVRLE